MKCSHCGCDMPDTAKFCGNCGTKLIVPQPDRPKSAIWFHASAPLKFILNNAEGTYWDIPAGDSFTDLDNPRNWEIQFCEDAFRFEAGQNLTAIKFENAPIECARYCKTFADCSNIHKLDLKSFEVRGAVSVDSMFEGCSSLFRLDLGGWNFASLKSCKRLFWGCDGLRHVSMAGCDARTIEIVAKALSMAALNEVSIDYR